MAEYNNAETPHANEDLLTMDEIQKKDAEAESMLAMTSGKNTKLAAMSDVPIQVTEVAQKALQKYQAGGAEAVILTLDMKTEYLSATVEEKTSVETVANSLPEKEGTYILYNWSHKDADGKAAKANVFTFYCPDTAPPKSKMFYASVKAHVQKIIGNEQIEISKSLEISDRKELTTKFFQEELYPQVVEKKVFAKPARRGRGKARMHGGAAFSPTAHEDA